VRIEVAVTVAPRSNYWMAVVMAGVLHLLVRAMDAV